MDSSHGTGSSMLAVAAQPADNLLLTIVYVKQGASNEDIADDVRSVRATITIVMPFPGNQGTGAETWAASTQLKPLLEKASVREHKGDGNEVKMRKGKETMCQFKVLEIEDTNVLFCGRASSVEEVWSRRPQYRFKTPDNRGLTIVTYHFKNPVDNANHWNIAVLHPRNPSPTSAVVEAVTWEQLASELTRKTVRLLIGTNKKNDEDPLLQALNQHVHYSVVFTHPDDPASICVLGGVRKWGGGHMSAIQTASPLRYLRNQAFPWVSTVFLHQPKRTVDNTWKSIIRVHGTTSNRSHRIKTTSNRHVKIDSNKRARIA